MATHKILVSEDRCTVTVQKFLIAKSDETGDKEYLINGLAKDFHKKIEVDGVMVENPNFHSEIDEWTGIADFVAKEVNL